MTAKNHVIKFIENAIRPKIETQNRELNIKINGRQFDSFPSKKTTDFPKNASKIRKRNYYIKRYKGLIKNILTKREDDKLHTYALSIITSNYIDYYSFYNSVYFEDVYYLRDQSIAKQELYEKLERLITVYQGRVSKKQP